MWGSPAPVQTEAEEVEGLKQMFAQPASPGGTQMGLGTYMKLSVANENRRIADKGREEKRELDALLEQRRIEQAERIRQLKAQRGEKDQEAIEERFREKNAIARFFLGASKCFKKGRGRARGRKRSLSAEVGTTVSLPTMPF